MATSLFIKLGFSLIAFAAIATLPACTQTQEESSNASTAKTIKIDGSSTVFPISEAIAKEYRQSHSKANIDLQFSGTSGGFKKFCAGETDISNASRPILTKEMDECVKAGVGFIELPIAFDALTVVVNPQNTWANDLTMAELKKMWEPAAQGKVMNWKQIRASFPDKPLKLFGAGNKSGTYDYFNEVTSGDPKASRSDYSGSEDDADTVRGVEGNAGALGYFGFAYYEANQNKLKALAIDSGKGAVLPSREAVEKATYQPFSRPLFIYINSKAAQENPKIKAFVEYYLTHAGRVSKTVGYTPLPADAYRLATIQFTRGEIGTAFDGVPQPNVTIAELLRRQATFQLSEQKADAKK
jgi:phosphate transport system substrate-binding protein